MHTITFTHFMPRMKTLILGSIIVQLMLALAAGTLYFVGSDSFLIWIELLVALAVVLFLLTLAFLWFTFLRQAEVKEKYRLKVLVRQTQAELTGIQATLSDVLVKKEMNQRQLQDEEQAEQARYQKLDNDLQEQVKSLGEAQKGEIASELARMQKEYLNEGLRNIALEPTQVPGIGDFLAEKLAANDIQTAFDVTSEAVYKIPGFGEAKTLSLLRWRESEEYKLKESQPAALPAEELSAIEQKYTQLVNEKQAEIQSARAFHDEAMQSLRTGRLTELTSLNEKEASARLRITILTNQQNEARAQLDQHSRITFLDMLAVSVFGAPAGAMKRALSLVAPLAYLATGVLNIIILIGALILGRG